MPLLITLSRLTVGIVLLLAGLVKFTHWPAFPPTVGRLLPLGANTAIAAALCVVACELAIGLMLLTGRLVHLGAASAAALLAVFAVVLAASILRGKRGQGCGCFGPRSRISWAHVLRNVSLATASLASVWPGVAAAFLLSGVMITLVSLLRVFGPSESGATLTEPLSATPS